MGDVLLCKGEVRCRVYVTVVTRHYFVLQVRRVTNSRLYRTCTRNRAVRGARLDVHEQPQAKCVPFPGHDLDEDALPELPDTSTKKVRE